jgi:hypothetical protein
LEAVKHRTYQQQQELDQIDRLMKEAADSMAGEWNFGDIKLPTPYEVQRRVQEVYGNAVNGGATPRDQIIRPSYAQHEPARGDTKVYIDGTDIGLVTKVIREYLGESATTTTTAARHT